MRVRTLALVVWFAVAVVVYARVGVAIDPHLEARRDTEHVLDTIREAVEAQPRGRAVYITNLGFRPLPLPPDMFPGWAAAFTIFHPDNSVDGRPVYFVDSRADVVGAARGGRRTQTLIVPPRTPGAE